MWSWSALGSAAFRRRASWPRRGSGSRSIDRHPYNTFQPLLYQVATGGLNAGDVTYSLRYFAATHKGVRFRRAAVTGIDHAANQVLCDDGVKISYDYLVLATGITTNHFGIPGAAEFTMSMYTRAEALRVRDTIFGSMEIIAGRSDPNSGGFTVLVAGGGATGVEMAGQLAELKQEALPSTYPELNPAQVHVVLVEMAPYLLAPFDDSLRKYALAELVKRGVDVRLNTAISEVHADRVDFKGGDVDPGRPGHLGGRRLGQPGAARVGHPDRPWWPRRGQLRPARRSARRTSSRSATSASPSTARCRSSRSRRSRPASSRPSRSPACTAARRRRSSSTTTRAPWPRSAAVTPCCRRRSGSSSRASSPGSAGSACTSSTSWAAATGSRRCSASPRATCCRAAATPSWAT